MPQPPKPPTAIRMPSRAEDRDITAAARLDPDAQPLTPRQLAAMRRDPVGDDAVVALAGVRFTLRAGTADDAIRIAALSVQVFLDTYATGGVRPDLAREVFAGYGPDAFAQRLADPGLAFIVAECAPDAGALPGPAASPGLVGYAEWRAEARAAPDGGVGGAEVVRLYVQPAFQRHGLGARLLHAVEAAAVAVPGREPGTGLWLTAWDGNHRARAFYASRGWLDVGATVHHIEGVAHGNRVFFKPLAKTIPGRPAR